MFIKISQECFKKFLKIKFLRNLKSHSLKASNNLKLLKNPLKFSYNKNHRILYSQKLFISFFACMRTHLLVWKAKSTRNEFSSNNFKHYRFVCLNVSSKKGNFIFLSFKKSNIFSPLHIFFGYYVLYFTHITFYVIS